MSWCTSEATRSSRYTGDVLNIAVLISGGGSNLKALIDATQNPDFPARIVCVGADTEAAGLAHAEAAGIPHFVIRPQDAPGTAVERREQWGQLLAAAIQEHGVGTGPNPGLVVSAGLMRILPAGFVRTFSPMLINTHPALLPLYPGAHAVRDALAAGATETGVTVHVIDEGVDTGPVIRQRSLQISPGESEAQVHERIKEIERPLLVHTVRDIAEGTIDLTQLVARSASSAHRTAGN